MPSIPTPPNGDNDSESGEQNDGSNPTDSNFPGGTDQNQGQGESTGNESQMPDDMVGNMPGDPNAQPGGDQTGNEAGGTMLPGDDGGGGDTGNDGWETSNQLPDPTAGETGGDDTDEQDDTGRSAEEGDLMQQVLGDLDGEILTERNMENSRASDAVAEDGSSGSGQLETGPNGAAGGTDDGDVATGRQDNTGMGDQIEPVLPEIEVGARDTPDATDKEVVARQLREAALAEEDPELKEKLWEEYENYVDGLK